MHSDLLTADVLLTVLCQLLIVLYSYKRKGQKSKDGVMRLTANRLTLPNIKRDDEFELLQKKIVELFERSPIITFALVVLIVWSAVIIAGGKYLGAQAAEVAPVSNSAQSSKQIVGLSQTVNSADLEAKLHAILNQPATLTIGGQTKQIDPEVIRSWLTITHDDKKSVDYIHVSAGAMTKSLNGLANKYVKTPVNQVVSTHDGASEIIVTGRNGTQLVNPGAINEQVKQSAKSVMDAKGLAFSTELAPLEFQSVTPAAFPKLIEVDVVTKQMYLYENGNVVRSYPISAGAPETPTPIGQFKIYAKFAKQDMRGNNPDGSKYFQPNVRWINYFLPGGYAVHGNYWRPQSWFGNINSSHGCVSLPDAQAKQVYDWAPIGTTVITHY